MASAGDDEVVRTRVSQQRFGQGRVDRGTAARVIGLAEPENGACRLFLLFEEERGSERPTDARQPRKAPAELLSGQCQRSISVAATGSGFAEPFARHRRFEANVSRWWRRRRRRAAGQDLDLPDGVDLVPADPAVVNPRAGKADMSAELRRNDPGAAAPGAARCLADRADLDPHP